MALKIDIRFGSFKDIGSAKGGPRAAAAGTLAVFAGKDAVLSQPTQAALGKAAVAQVARAAASAKFKGAANACLEILAPEGLAFDRLLVVGTHRKAPADNKPDTGPHDARLGGALMAKLSAPGKAQVLLDPPGGASAETAAALLLGLRLRGYKFDLYKTKKKDDENGDNGDNGAAKKSAAKKPDEALDILVAVADPAAARRAAAAQEAIAAGVIAARDLVNEPANILTPMEFAKRAAELKKLGVVIEILDERKMQRLGMNTLLGVAQGSRNPPRLVIMRWNGGGRAKPVAFIGKGVTFDTGGISIKPAGSMEDMKGDMAGAACVTGLMRTLAMRKAKANVIGAIGLVENMPDGNAQRPGDIVKSMSGQTVEIINTDAEGRLVLADVLWHIQDKYKPQFMINLATLTGAILISLGNEYAGLFSNNDELSERLSKLGMTTGEKVWRMPMGPAYDKMLDSKFADMKNVGGRLAGSITAAQFLQRFVNKTPWVHLDVAGTAMSSPSDEINQSWGSGWGVRLLNALVAEHYEK